MDWGDFVQYKKNDKIETGFVHFISHEDNYIELVNGKIYNEDNSVNNDSWIGIYLDTSESGMSINNETILWNYYFIASFYTTQH